MRPNLTLCACLLLLGASSCSRRVKVSLEVFVTSPAGQALRLASTPVKVVEQDALAHALASIGTEGATTAIAVPDYRSFFEGLVSRKGFEGVYTDADGKVVLRRVGEDDFVVAYAQRSTGEGNAQYLWIARVADARDGLLLLGSHNQGGSAISGLVDASPGLKQSLAAQLFARAQDALRQQDAVAAMQLASNSLRLAPSAKVRSFLRGPPAVAQQQARIEALLGVRRADRHEARRPSYFDCERDRVVVWPGNRQLTWEALQKAGNPLEVRLNGIQTHSNEEYAVITARPGSVKFFRVLRNFAGRRGVDVAYRALDSDTVLDWDEHQRCLVFRFSVGTTNWAMPFKPAPTAPTDKSAVFFECRGNEVFFMDKEELDQVVQQTISRIDPKVRDGDLSEFLKVVASREIGNRCYRIDLRYLLTGQFGLELRPGVSGDDLSRLAGPTNIARDTLKQLSTNKVYVVFLVHEDSFGAFRAARGIAEETGFQTGWELVGADERIKFGIGGSVIRPQ